MTYDGKRHLILAVGYDTIETITNITICKLITQLIDVSYSYEVEMLLILTAIFVQFFRLTTYRI